MKISSNTLGLAAEFAVASELCRRDIYAQLTLGHLKRTDLLILNEETSRMLRVEVKSKQGKDWPNCKGIYGDNAVLVFVDFAGKGEFDRPDFYILTVEDWIEYANKEIANHPKKRIKLDERNVPIWLDQINRSGQPYKGMGVTADKIQQHREKWGKVIQMVGRVEANRAI